MRLCTRGLSVLLYMRPVYVVMYYGVCKVRRVRLRG